MNYEVKAQDVSSNSVTKQIWLDFNPSRQLSDKINLNVPVGARTIFPKKWYRFWIGPRITYKWPRLILKKLRYKEELHGGIDIFYTANIDAVNRLEIAPYQGYSLVAPNRLRLVIRHYVELKERFELETDDWNNTFGLRLSYEPSITFRFQGDLWEHGKGFYIPVSMKFYWNLIGTKQFNDKVRLMPGIGKEFSPEFKMAFFVGYNYTRNTIDEDFHTNDIIFRFRVYYKFKKKQKEGTING
jgi:hypothetical protein